MTASTRRTVLSLYMRVFRIARSWQAQSGVKGDTEMERNYILQEACTLFRQNQQLTDQESIKRSIEECEARIDIGLHYRNPYPRPVNVPTTAGIGNSERQEAESTAAPEEAGQANILTVI
ncbi:LYR motif containing protein 1 isoform X2 [Cyclopterus lumpus]|uniref:LYR motif containing protein 1 isoform X2 n=1 Tax=Cyclopterus lumpus TaxID=8103 RepID=UPI001486E8EC|nr:LYR motif containing protein 1 isoform X2 [Cyclopterus lumpus]